MSDPRSSEEKHRDTARDTLADWLVRMMGVGPQARDQLAEMLDDYVKAEVEHLRAEDRSRELWGD